MTVSIEIVSEEELSRMAESTLKMDMSIKSAKDMINILFMDYKPFLRVEGLYWAT